MPLVGTTTQGPISRSRIASYVAATESYAAVALADAAATLTVAQVTVSKLFTIAASANRALTTPTGAELGAAVTDEVVGTSFEFTVVNTGASTATLTAGVSGVTVVGNAVVAATSSGTFLAVFTAADTVSIYRK
jgi:hypothetical protein